MTIPTARHTSEVVKRVIPEEGISRRTRASRAARAALLKELEVNPEAWKQTVLTMWRLGFLRVINPGECSTS
jgi:hypothetical protein